MSEASRRSFLASAALIGARGYAQVRGANERLRVGVIGCGGMATGHIRTLLKMKESDHAEVIAVCDIYEKNLERAAGLTGARKYKEYRELLANKDIDYVVIGSPEHWHYQMAFDAASAGKHIYCEKPMTRTAEEAGKLVEKIRASRVKMQVGVQGMSDDSYETANRYVREDALGKVVLAQIDYSRNHKEDFWTRPVDPDVKPGVNLDWKAWLGPAPKRPFDPDRFMGWRRYWDYSTGIASDLFIHRVTRIIRSLGLKFPRYGVGSGGKFGFSSSPAEVPDTMNILLDYPEGLSVQLISSMANDARVEHMLRGRKATLYFTPQGFEIRPQKTVAPDMQPIVHQKTGAESTELHHRNLMAAIRSNEPLKCDCELGWYGVVAAGMGVVSYRKRQYVAWDANKRKIVKA